MSCKGKIKSLEEHVEICYRSDMAVFLEKYIKKEMDLSGSCEKLIVIADGLFSKELYENASKSDFKDLYLAVAQLCCGYAGENGSLLKYLFL